MAKFCNFTTCLIEKMKIKKKRPWMAHHLKSYTIWWKLKKHRNQFLFNQNSKRTEGSMSRWLPKVLELVVAQRFSRRRRFASSRENFWVFSLPNGLDGEKEENRRGKASSQNSKKPPRKRSGWKIARLSEENKIKNRTHVASSLKRSN